jgi:hypothetical protein
MSDSDESKSIDGERTGTVIDLQRSETSGSLLTDDVIEVVAPLKHPIETATMEAVDLSKSLFIVTVNGLAQRIAITKPAVGMICDNHTFPPKMMC